MKEVHKSLLAGAGLGLTWGTNGFPCMGKIKRGKHEELHKGSDIWNVPLREHLSNGNEASEEKHVHQKWDIQKKCFLWKLWIIYFLFLQIIVGEVAGYHDPRYKMFSSLIRYLWLFKSERMWIDVPWFCLKYFCRLVNMVLKEIKFTSFYCLGTLLIL